VIRLAIAAILAELADQLTFGMAVGRDGIHGESNPVVVALYHAVGLYGVGAVKLVAVAFVVWVAYRLRSSFVLWVVIALGLVGAATNVLLA
jgi:hypothetical protein